MARPLAERWLTCISWRLRSGSAAFISSLKDHRWMNKRFIQNSSIFLSFSCSHSLRQRMYPCSGLFSQGRIFQHARSQGRKVTGNVGQRVTGNASMPTVMELIMLLSLLINYLLLTKWTAVQRTQAGQLLQVCPWPFSTWKSVLKLFRLKRRFYLHQKRIENMQGRLELFGLHKSCSVFEACGVGLPLSAQGKASSTCHSGS